ncbi:carbonic anhydrase [Crepidotus variabilis]|uniref:Carbonic anhydrase n=1 Tax=Crepidotus variabilis TaxID=179855 RepID=A0A9P6EG59_9AGAR|nr:carbonic anhydrase [Crepidotus variabilis]
MTLSSSNQTEGFRSLQQLFNGNKKFRQGVRVSAERAVEGDPGFMFLGCLDNRLTPSTIFNAPSGSLVTHNNIGNQYSTKDAGADAAVAYAIESLQVQHIIVLGHYGCKGVANAITKSQKVSQLVRKWIKPISDMYAVARRVEIVKLRDSRMPRRGQPNGITDSPPSDDPGFRAVVEENVKRNVRNLRENKTLQQAFSRKLKTDEGKAIDVFVHGFVYDEGTGDVNDLHVSYGPPGKVIPHIPFKAVKAAQNYQGSGGGIKKGKTWDFKAHHM